MNSDQNNLIFKILVVGSSGVGKTSLIHRFVENRFFEGLRATIGVDFTLKTMKLNQISSYDSITLQIWDLAGENQFHSIIPLYIQGTHGLILSFDTTNYTTLDELNNWLNLINQHLTTSVPTVLISTKHDLSERQTHFDAINLFKKRYDITHYFPTSAKSGLGVKDTFARITELVARSFSLM